MGTYSSQVLGSDLCSEGSDLFSAQMESVEKLIQKLEKNGRKKKSGKKNLKKKLRALEQELERVTALEEDLRKRKKKKKGNKRKKKLQQQIRKEEQERQQRDQWLQDAVTTAFLSLIGSATVSVNWLPPSKNRSAIALPASQGDK